MICLLNVGGTQTDRIRYFSNFKTDILTDYILNQCAKFAIHVSTTVTLYFRTITYCSQPAELRAWRSSKLLNVPLPSWSNSLKIFYTQKKNTYHKANLAFSSS